MNEAFAGSDPLFFKRDMMDVIMALQWSWAGSLMTTLQIKSSVLEN